MSEDVHSAEFFGPLRDAWWNRDYLELLMRRLGLAAPQRVLDVGCGQGHWGQALAQVLPAGSTITGIDREPQSLAVARERSAALRALPVTFAYALGDALAIEFPDESFDLVTCQTVLIHLADPSAGLREMLRVLRPGGWILCAEPNNLGGAIDVDSEMLDRDPEVLLAGAELQLRCEIGKARLGEGFNSAGELVPGFLAAMNVESLEVWLSDKALPLWPPYAQPHMADAIATARQNLADERLIWTKEPARRYWLAGGGTAERFDAIWPVVLGDLVRSVDGLTHGTWHAAGGSLMYVIAARKV